MLQMMTLNISDQVLQASGLTEEELTLEIAVALYQREILSLGKAADFAGLHRMAFQAALYERKVPINYDIEDLEDDLETLEKLGL
jgi:predicted HTH domain antitoxin